MKCNRVLGLAVWLIFLVIGGCSGGGGGGTSGPGVTVPTTTVSGTVSLPAGESVANYKVVSLGATTPLSSQGGFSTQVYQDGVAVIAAMPTGKDFGLMNVVCSSSTSSMTKAAAQIFSAGMQKTATSPASGVTLNAKTTAVSLVFISPYLLTNDPAVATQLLSIIENDPLVNTLATLIDSLYSKRDPLSEQSLQHALASAIQSVVNTLSIQQISPSAQVATAAATPAQKIIRLPKASARSLEAAILGTENTYYSYQDYISVNTDESGNSYHLSIESKNIGGVDWIAEVMKLAPSQFSNYNDFKLKSSVGTTVYQNERAGLLGHLNANAKSYFRYIDVIDVATEQISSTLYGEKASKYVSLPTSSDGIYLVRSYSGSWGDKDLKKFVRNSVPNGASMDSQALIMNITLAALDGLNLLIDTKSLDLTDVVQVGIEAASEKVANVVQGDKPQLKDIVSISQDVLLAMFKKVSEGVLDKSLENMLTKSLEIIGKSLIDLPGKISSGGKIVDRAGQMLISATAMESALVVVGNPFAIAQTPTIGQNQTIGVAGSRFVQWGMGFSPNTDATLHFMMGNSELSPAQEPVRADGTFSMDYVVPQGKTPGTYTWWGVDAGGKESNHITYTIGAASTACAGGSGNYCGNTTKGQDAGYLYSCVNGVYTLKTICSNGCQQNASGVNDTCKSLTAGCPGGNGLYCGDPNKGLNSNYLYQCSNGNYTLQTACATGCQNNAMGVNDSCKTTTSVCLSGNGLYCGSASISGQNTGYLYQCTNGTYTLSQACGNGCQVNGAGVNDTCKSAPAASCPSGNGLYCGSSSLGQNTSYLYQCSNGSYTLSQGCSNGCQSNGAGVNDSCKAAPVPTCPSGNGLYCGSSSLGQNTGYLYECTNGGYSLLQQCSNGCQSNGAGVNDSCKAPAPTCPTGNGLYCGSSSLGQNTSYLYQCTNGSYTVSQQCTNGCQSNGAGVNDSCKAAPAPTCPSGNGLYCGSSSLGQNTSYLYLCTNGSYSVSQHCSNGCQSNGAGVNDSCKVSSSCPSGNGLYCGSSVGLTSNVLYSCSNGVFTKSKTCSNGCKVAAPGTNDYCK